VWQGELVHRDGREAIADLLVPTGVHAVVELKPAGEPGRAGELIEPGGDGRDLAGHVMRHRRVPQSERAQPAGHVGFVLAFAGGGGEVVASFELVEPLGRQDLG
jgi:hypothetical protein